jgi:hypothetical protein
VPRDDDGDFQWLSLIQHYGVPTPLLDFTWWPYVAAHLALDLAQTDCAVFAVDTRVFSSDAGPAFHDLRIPGLYRSD